MKHYRSGWVRDQDITEDRVKSFVRYYGKKIRGHHSGSPDTDDKEHQNTTDDLNAYKSWHTGQWGWCDVRRERPRLFQVLPLDLSLPFFGVEADGAGCGAQRSIKRIAVEPGQQRVDTPSQFQFERIHARLAGWGDHDLRHPGIDRIVRRLDPALLAQPRSAARRRSAS
ncbi:MAG: hypothetical protein WDN69_30890 [Aliidongia sp.]